MNNSNGSDAFGGNAGKFGTCTLKEGNINIFDGVLFILISTLAIIGNIIVFICYGRFRVLRTVTNVFMISLSASDLFVAVISIPFSFGVFVCGLIPDSSTDMKTYTFIYLICDLLPSILSIYSLTLVAVDRAIAITKPFFHNKYVTRKTAWISVAVTWLFLTASMGLMFLINERDFTLLSIFLAYAIPVSIMIASYTLMGLVAKKHASELAELDKTMSRLRAETRNNNELRSDSLTSNTHLMTGETNVSASLKPIVVTYRDRLTENGDSRITKWFQKSMRRLSSPKATSLIGGMKSKRRELKAALTLSMILSCFILSWTPFIALNIEFYRCQANCIEARLLKYFKLLHYSNSALNPLLYILLNKRWRAAFYQIVCFCNKRKYISETANGELFGW